MLVVWTTLVKSEIHTISLLSTIFVKHLRLLFLIFIRSLRFKHITYTKFLHRSQIFLRLSIDSQLFIMSITLIFLRLLLSHLHDLLSFRLKLLSSIRVVSLHLLIVFIIYLHDRVVIALCLSTWLFSLYIHTLNMLIFHKAFLLC